MTSDGVLRSLKVLAHPCTTRYIRSVLVPRFVGVCATTARNQIYAHVALQKLNLTVPPRTGTYTSLVDVLSFDEYDVASTKHTEKFGGASAPSLSA